MINTNIPVADSAERTRKAEELKRVLPPYSEYTDLKKKTNTEMCGACPACGGDDRFIVRTDSNRFFCRGCNERGGDLIDFHEWKHNKTFMELLTEYLPDRTKTYEVKNPVDSVKPSGIDKLLKKAFKGVEQQHSEMLYPLLVDRRKLQSKTVDYAVNAGLINYGFHSVGKNPQPKPKLSMVTEYKDLAGNPVKMLQYHTLDETPYINKDGGKYDKAVVNYNADTDSGFFIPGNNFEKAEKLVIVESVINALSIFETCPIDVCAVCIGSTSYVKKISKLEPYRDKGKQIICFYDNDEPGMKAARATAEILGDKVKTVVWPKGTQEGHDVNDLIKKDDNHSAIPEMIEQAVPVRQVLPETPEQKVVAEFNKKHATLMNNGQFRVITFTTNPVTRAPDFTLSSRHDFESRYLPETVLVEKVGQKPKEMQKSKVWLSSPDKIHYDGITFDPSGKGFSGYYNLWTGFSVEPKAGNWSLLRNHIKDNLADDNLVIFNYILDWMARLIQDPGGKRPGVTLVLRGEQGTGKSFFAEQIGKLFPTHYLKVSQASQVTGKHNDHLKGKLLFFVDEGFWAGDKKAEGILKDMITSDTLTIEPKFTNVMVIPSHLNIIIASNNDWIVPAGANERRFCVLDVANANRQNHKYFAAIAEQMDNSGREAMLHELLNRKKPSLASLKNFPRTEALFEQAVNSMDAVTRHWFEVLKRGYVLEEHNLWLEYIPTKNIFDEYRCSTRESGIRFTGDIRQFGMKLKKLCPSIKKYRANEGGARIQKYIFPELKICRADFEKIMGYKINWTDDN